MRYFGSAVMFLSEVLFGMPVKGRLVKWSWANSCCAVKYARCPNRPPVDRRVRHTDCKLSTYTAFKPWERSGMCCVETNLMFGSWHERFSPDRQFIIPTTSSLHFPPLPLHRHFAVCQSQRRLCQVSSWDPRPPTLPNPALTEAVNWLITEYIGRHRPLNPALSFTFAH